MPRPRRGDACAAGTCLCAATGAPCAPGEACTAAGCGAPSGGCSLPWGGSVDDGASVTAYAATSVPCDESCASETRSCANGALSGSYGAPACRVSVCACEAGVLGCVDASAGVCNAVGTAWAGTTSCAAGTTCERGSCVGPIAWHLDRSVDQQWVQSYDAAELDGCAASAATDRAAGRLLCDVRHALETLRPRFGLFYGNSWHAFVPGSADPCLHPETARSCLAARFARVTARLQADNPHLLLAGHLAECVHRNNVPASDWPGICRGGSLGAWGADTCVRDLEGQPSARAYLMRTASRREATVGASLGGP